MQLCQRILILSLLLVIAEPILSAEDSPISSGTLSTDNSPAAIAAARERGAAGASRDIAAGTFRILYYGKPWPVGKPLVDETTGYRVQVLAGCVVTEPFVAEDKAYNDTMRAWHAKQSSTSTRK